MGTGEKVVQEGLIPENVTAANGKTVNEIPTFAEPQFLRWKLIHGVTTEDLQSTAPRTS